MKPPLLWETKAWSPVGEEAWWQRNGVLLEYMGVRIQGMFPMVIIVRVRE